MKALLPNFIFSIFIFAVYRNLPESQMMWFILIAPISYLTIQWLYYKMVDLKMQEINVNHQ